MPIEIVEGTDAADVPETAEAIGIAPEPKDPSRLRLWWLSLPRWQRLVILVEPLAIAGILVVGLSYWSSHHPLARVASQYQLIQSPIGIPTRSGDTVTYSAGLAPQGPIAAGLRRVRLLASSKAVTRLVISGEPARINHGAAAYKTPVALATYILGVDVKVDPTGCELLPRVLSFAVDSYGPDRRMHHARVDLERYPLPAGDPLLDPALFPDLCTPPAGSVLALPRSDEPGGWAHTQGNTLTTRTGAEITVGTVGSISNAFATSAGYVVGLSGGQVDASGGVLYSTIAFDRNGHQLWSHNGFPYEADVTGRRVVIAVASGAQIRDALTGRVLATLSLPSFPSGLSWAGKDVLVNYYYGRDSRGATSVTPAGATYYGLVNLWRVATGKLEAPGDVIADDYRVAARLRGYPKCSASQTYAALFGAINTGAGALPVFVGTGTLGDKGALLTDQFPANIACPRPTVLSRVAPTVALVELYAEHSTVVELTVTHAPRLSLAQRANEYAFDKVRESASSWFAIVRINPDPRTYRIPDARDEQLSALVLVRCHIGGSCERVGGILPEGTRLVG